MGPGDCGKCWAQEGERLAREGGGTRLQRSRSEAVPGGRNHVRLAVTSNLEVKCILTQSRHPELQGKPLWEKPLSRPALPASQTASDAEPKASSGGREAGLIPRVIPTKSLAPPSYGSQREPQPQPPDAGSHDNMEASVRQGDMIST